MAEYIEKQAALDAILSETPDAHYPSWYAERIKALPAADIVPVVHGVWLEKEEETYCPVLYGEDAEPILHKYTRYICNLCGRSSTVPELYCHCGAKMDDEPIPFAEIDETRRKYEAFCREKGYNDE